MLQYSFFVNAMIGVAVISVAAAVIGTYIITRRLVASPMLASEASAWAIFLESTR